MDLIVALKLPLIILRILFDLITAALFGLFLRPRGWSYRRHLTYTFLRSLTGYGLFNLLSKPKHTNALDVYYEYMDTQKSSPEVVMLDGGAAGCWIGSPNAKEVLMYFHGGGYTHTPQPNHFAVLSDLVEAAEKQGKDFGVFVLSYALAPKARYPVQLIQAVDALKYLIEKAGLDPENIYVAGDSAGGNLAIALLSSLSHPHPAAAKIDLKGKKLGGAFLISPWVTFDVTTVSMKENANKDFVNGNSSKSASLLFLGGAKQDAYNAPLSAEAEWWQDLRVSEVCAVSAEYEVFRDDIKAWMQKVKVYNPQAEYFLAPAEVHVQSVVDRIFGLGMAKSEEYFRSWILNRLGSVTKT